MELWIHLNFYSNYSYQCNAFFLKLVLNAFFQPEKVDDNKWSDIRKPESAQAIFADNFGDIVDFSYQKTEWDIISLKLNVGQINSIVD